jgi:hypothetical protein
MSTDNKIMLVIANSKNILTLSLKFCNNIQFVISSDNIKNAKEFYHNHNIDLKNKLITTFDTGFDPYIYSINYNKYDNIFHSLVFFSKIINKQISLNSKKKYDITICVERKHVKRVLIMASHIIKNVNTMRILHISTDPVTEEDNNFEKIQLNMFYNSFHYR